MKLSEGSIKNWGDLEKFFFTRFFEDDSEIIMPTLLVTKQQKGESVKAFGEISEYSAPMPQWHDLGCLGGNMPPQFANLTSNSDRSS